MNKILSCSEKDKLIENICSVYKYKHAKKKQLYKLSDNQLFAYSKSLKKNGRIYINTLLAASGSNTYIIDNNYIYLGFETGINDIYGNEKKYQLGYIKVDDKYKIIESEINGDKTKIYNGLKVIL